MKLKQTFVTHETGEKAAAKAVAALNDGDVRVESVIRVEGSEE